MYNVMYMISKSKSLVSKNVFKKCIILYLQSVRLAMPANVVIGTLGVSPFILASFWKLKTIKEFIVYNFTQFISEKW